MVRRTFSRVAVAVFSLLGILALSAVVSARQVDAAPGGWIDTSNRGAVTAAYDAEFSKAVPAIGWTGNRSGCVAGTTSAAYRRAIFDRVNYFRAMAGVPTGVTENATYSARAQQAALMMSVTGRLSHSPDSSFGCRTSAGVTGAGSSNLYLGRTGPRAIDGYVEDPGASNTRVGHRSWILHPTTRQMGTGDLPGTGGWSSNALWVFDNVFGTQPALREPDGFVAWPPRGFVPGEVVYPRWSVSLRNADFSGASVSVSANGRTLNAPVVHRDGASGGAPFPVIVWEPQGVERFPAVDTVHQVTVSGVRINGVSRTLRYNVTILGGEPGSGASTGLSASDFEGLVEQAYLDFVGRKPTNNELAFWSGRLATGTTRGEFVTELSRSDVWTASVVDRMYGDTLGRTADAGGRQFWIRELQRGRPVADVAANFYGSPEYLRLQGGSYESWLRDLYGELLERPVDAGGLAFWVRRSGQVGTGTVAYQFYQSPENREVRVRAMYRKFLGREPDGGGLAYWSGMLGNGDDLALAAFLASSDEYWRRAQ